MQEVHIQAQERKEQGRSAAQRARRQGFVPGVLYGKKVHKLLYVRRHDLNKIVYTLETYLVNVELNGETFQCVIREVQYHPVHDYIIHVDFYCVPKGEPVTVELPVKLVGVAPGVLAGGRLVQQIRKMRVKGLIKDLPSTVEVDVSNLQLGKALLVRDLPPYPFRVRMAPTVAIARIEIPRALRVQREQQQS